MRINALNLITDAADIQSGDTVPFSSATYGDDVRASWATVAEKISAILALDKGALATQIATPTASGFTATITVKDTWLLLTPTGAFAAGTIALPSATDGAEVLVNCTQAVTALTITGGTVVGAPTALTANAFFRLRYSTTNATWYRVG